MEEKSESGQRLTSRLPGEKAFIKLQNNIHCGPLHKYIVLNHLFSSQHQNWPQSVIKCWNVTGDQASAVAGGLSGGCTVGRGGVATPVFTYTSHGLNAQPPKGFSMAAGAHSEVSRGKYYILWPQCLSFICDLH